ncbi:MAG: hypothetical protein A2W31_05105 [Planctomycetes bacterium RBG_16_64_10]|nr:MAG: hypothetical protein A2W31_05105 [Planctomycetes bacterium RBG_16_64_10]
MGDQRQRQEASQPVTVNVPAPVVSQSPDMKPVSELRSEVQASSNQTTNALTGLGVQVSKVAEKVDAALVKVDASFQATASLRADMSASASATAVLTNAMSAQATAIANLKLALEGIAQGQIGLKNSIETTSQTVASGRDSHVQTIQFTKEMMETLKASYEAQLAQTKSDNRTLFWTVTILMATVAGIVALVLEGSRRRAEARCLAVIRASGPERRRDA